MRKLLICTMLALMLLLSHAGAERREITLLSRGVHIPATLTLPDGISRSCPIVVMAHGHGGSREENYGFGAIADTLAEHGIGSIRMDFAGCGESEEDFLLNSLTTMKQDMLAAMHHARSKLLAPRIGLFGYSMGGRAVLELLAEGSAADAVALLAPANDLNNLIETAFPNFHAMHQIAKRDGFYPLREGETLSAAWFDDLLRYDDPAAAAAQAYKGPTLIAYAQDDYVVQAHVSEHAAEMLGAETYDATGKGHIYGFWLPSDPLREHLAEAIAEFFGRHLSPSSGY